MKAWDARADEERAAQLAAELAQIDRAAELQAAASCRRSHRYRGDRRRTNVVLSAALNRAAQQYFPRTKYGSLSGFIAAKVRQEMRKSAAKMRAAGIEIPEGVLTK